MTKEVLLSLQGLQFDAVSADGDKIETITPAEYYKRNDSHYVIFEEAMEGFQEKTKNVIKFKENSLDLTKNRENPSPFFARMSIFILQSAKCS